MTRNGSTGYELQRRGEASPASFFAATRIGRRYVSFYLMPIYMHAELLEGTTDGLRRRMQGKSCFNFTSVDETLVAELAALTERAYAAFESPAYPRRRPAPGAVDAPRARLAQPRAARALDREAPDGRH